MPKLLCFLLWLIVGLAGPNPLPAQHAFDPLEELDFWSQEELPLPVYFWENGNSGVDGDSGLALDSGGALQAAIDTWNTASSISPGLNSPGFSFQGTSSTYQENAINVGFGQLEGPFGDPVGVAIIDYNVDFSNPQLPRCLWKATGADIVINQEFSFTTELSATDHFDLQSIFTHELGHVLGLPHRDNSLAVMNPVSNRLRDLQPLDLLLLDQEELFNNPICPLDSAGRLQWSLSADSGSGTANIENALSGGVLVGDLPQTVVPGFIEPEPEAIVTAVMEESTAVEALTISMTDGFLSDGSSSIEFGVTVEDLNWIDGLQRELLDQNADGEVQLDVVFSRRMVNGPNDISDVTDTASILASVSFDGSNLEIYPVSYEFDSPLNLDLTTLQANGLTGIQISGVRFGIRAVPEPGAALILLPSLAMLACRRRRIR